MSQLELPVKIRTRPTLGLESCVDFFDRDYDVLLADVENRVIKFAWNIAAGPKILPVDATAPRKEIRIYAESAWAFYYQQPMPVLSEEAVYQLIIPGRDIKSTELQRILACSQQLVHELKGHFTITRPPQQADGPNSYTKFSRASIIAFLKSRRIS